MCRLFGPLTLCLLFSTAANAQEFVLEVPGDPTIRSSAVMEEDRLTIEDVTGRQFTYVRRPQYDTPDGRYLAFYSAKADRLIRWPVAGRGPLQIGTPVVDRVEWSLSQMFARPVGAGAAPVPGAVVRPTHGGYVAAVATGADREIVAIINAEGNLQFFLGFGDRWDPVPAELRAGLLVPGAPLRLVADTENVLPVVYTVGAAGDFLQISAGNRARKLGGLAEGTFAPGTDFDVAVSGQQTSLFAVDQRGQLWELDGTAGRHVPIEKREGLYQAGIPVRAAPGGNEIFLVDRQGTLVAYTRDPKAGWIGPEGVASGFVSGGDLAVWLDAPAPGTAALRIAAVNRDGRLQTLQVGENGWERRTVVDLQYLPGTPLAVLAGRDAIRFLLTTSAGDWVELLAGELPRERVIASGFPAQAPIAAESTGPSAFAVDLTGRVVGAQLVAGEWRSVLLQPVEERINPRIAQRRVVLEETLPPATVGLVNSHNEELVVRILDNRVPGRVQEVVLPPGAVKRVPLDRDPGGVLVERFIVPGPLGEPVERVRRVPVPPRAFYDVVVYANRVTYQYVDRRNVRGPVPDFQESSLVTIGAFPLPAGDVLANGMTIDVYRAAVSGRNPGAAALLDPALP